MPLHCTQRGTHPATHFYTTVAYIDTLAVTWICACGRLIGWVREGH